MIEEKITGSKKNIEWKKGRLLEDPQIRIKRISGLYPVTDKDGLYFIYVKYDRIPKKKRRSRW